MKHAIAIAVSLVLAVSLLLAGCAKNKASDESVEGDSEFVIVETTGIWFVVYDSDTLVMYAVSRGGYNAGTFTLLVDEDGNPKLYEKAVE